MNCIERYFDPTPPDSLADGPSLAESGVPPWAIVSCARAVNGDLDRVADTYGVPLDAARAALAYYALHQALIGAQIVINTAIFA